MSEEDIQPMAPGLLQAYAPEEADEMPDPRRRRRNQDDPIANLSRAHLLLRYPASSVKSLHLLPRGVSRRTGVSFRTSTPPGS